MPIYRAEVLKDGMTGLTVSHYRVLERIGEGSSGQVYKAEDLSLGRPVALKFIPVESATNDSSILRFQLEARTASALNHPNICTVHDIGDYEGRPFIVMELLEGQVLSQRIDGKPMPVADVVDVGMQIADALDAAHLQRIVHRDLKPGNLFVTHRGQAKVLDFGLAVFAMPSRVDLGASSSSGPAGTLPYMSPEQVHQEELDGRSDLFSLGTVLYQMSTGARPFSGSTKGDVLDSILNHQPASPLSLNPQLPPELDRIIRKALEKNRKLRYQTASDLCADLRRLQRDMDTVALVPVVMPPRPQSPRALARWAVVLIAGCVVGGVALERFLAQSEPIEMPLLAAPEPVRLPAPPLAPLHPAVERTTAAASAVVKGEDPARRQAQEELRIGRAKIDAKLFDQALETLTRLVTTYGATEEAVDGYFLMASIHQTRKQPENAMATFVEIANRHPEHSRAPEALYELGRTTLRTSRPDREQEALETFTQVADRYPSNPWAARALLERGALEMQLNRYQRDDTLGRSVPAALVTYRTLINRYPGSPVVRSAIERLAALAEDIKQFELAAEMYTRLAEKYPADSDEAWFLAGELYRRRLRDDAKAADAYRQVPSTSRHFRSAQRFLKEANQVQ